MNGHKPASELVRGDKIVTEDGRIVTVERVSNGMYINSLVVEFRGSSEFGHVGRSDLVKLARAAGVED